MNAESTHKGVNQHLKSVTRIQQQSPELPMVALTWHACKYKVHDDEVELHVLGCRLTY